MAPVCGPHGPQGSPTPGAQYTPRIYRLGCQEVGEESETGGESPEAGRLGLQSKVTAKAHIAHFEGTGLRGHAGASKL